MYKKNYHCINNSLLEYIGTIVDFKNGQKLLTQNDFIQISEKIISTLKLEKGLASVSQFWFKQGEVEKSFAIEDFSQTQFLANVIALEHKAHQENKGLLYRATTESKPFFIPGRSMPSVALEPTVLIKKIHTYTPVIAAQLNIEYKTSLPELKQNINILIGLRRPVQYPMVTHFLQVIFMTVELAYIGYHNRVQYYTL